MACVGRPSVAIQRPRAGTALYYELEVFYMLCRLPLLCLPIDEALQQVLDRPVLLVLLQLKRAPLVVEGFTSLVWKVNGLHPACIAE